MEQEAISKKSSYMLCGQLCVYALPHVYVMFVCTVYCVYVYRHT